jgi:flagellar basal body-associated protein FliL
MLKQSSSKMKKVLAISLIVLFVVSLTAAAVSASLAIDVAALNTNNAETHSHNLVRYQSLVSHDDDKIFTFGPKG